MAYKNLEEFIDILEKEGELLRIKTFVNPILEIAEITDRISKTKDGGKALLFENNGTEFPLLINAFGSEKRMNLALKVTDLDDIGKELEAMFKNLSSPKNNFFDKLKLIPELGKMSSYMPKSVSGRGKSQEIIETEPDLNKFPVLQCWPHDGGKFITLPMVITKDPKTGIRNVGMYRMQIFDKDLTGMHWHKHKVGARHFNEYKELGKKMPIAVAIGGDPAYTYAATAPLPDNVDEFMLAGFLRKKSVKLVKAITQDIEVPDDADIIIEGYVDSQEDFILEGPFGDHTGFYSLADYYPKFHVTCITHRKRAVYPTTIVGIPPQEDAYIGKATERIFLTPIKLTMLPELKDMNLPFYGVAHNLTIVSIKKDFAGHALKVMNSLWGAGQMMFNKNLIIVDENVNVHDYKQVANAFLNNVDVNRDLHFSLGPMDILDHSAPKYSYGSKMCIDATVKFEEEIYNSNKSEFNENIDISEIKRQFTDIQDISASFLNNKSAILFISVNKSAKNYIKTISENLINSKLVEGVKFIAFFDKEVDISDNASAVWLLTNNIDPKRDCKIIENNNSYTSVFDACKKSFETDNFERDWPNIIIADNQTIKLVDEKWESLNIGEFIKSPSLYYKALVSEKGAIAIKFTEIS
ncbi:MAG: menaquinone biosynthesis decarboxylase [Bacteroidales bacterium]|nr:menaquinone biosynthesis decarboxylase [Bacteroidales bacterium]MBN2758296.1 menaquinone biosynthesis decarboxylase [Bacteroidales bacterium]